MRHTKGNPVKQSFNLTPDLQFISANIGTASLAAVLSHIVAFTHLFTILAILITAQLVTWYLSAIALREEINATVIRIEMFAQLTLFILIGTFCMILSTFYEEQAYNIITYVFWLACISEAYRITTNYQSIRTRRRIEDKELVSLILGRFRAIFVKILGGLK